MDKLSTLLRALDEKRAQAADIERQITRYGNDAPKVLGDELVQTMREIERIEKNIVNHASAARAATIDNGHPANVAMVQFAAISEMAQTLASMDKRLTQVEISTRKREHPQRYAARAGAVTLVFLATTLLFYDVRQAFAMEWFVAWLVYCGAVAMAWLLLLVTSSYI